MASLRLDGSESFDILGLSGGVTPGLCATLLIHRHGSGRQTISGCRQPRSTM